MVQSELQRTITTSTDNLVDKRLYQNNVLQRSDRSSLWERFCQWVTSTDNRLYRTHLVSLPSPV